MYDTIEQLETGIEAYRKMKRRRFNQVLVDESDDDETGIDEEHNLVDDVPDDAWELWQEMPADPREIDGLDVTNAWERYPEEDLANIIQDAVDSGKIVDLGSETYQFKKENLPVELTSDHHVFGVVGNESNPATIHFNEVKEGRTIFFKTRHSSASHSINSGYLYNVVFNIEGETSEGLTPDAGIIRLFVEDEFWAHNVVLEGTRKRWQSVTGSDPVQVGGYCTWLVDVTSESGTAFHHRVKLDGGMEIDPERAIDVINEGRTAKFTQGIPFGNALGHYGTAVYKDCSVSDSPGSGWYISNKWDSERYDEPQPDSPSRVSRNILWNCESHNCAMRIGENDRIIGGRVTYDDYWLDRAEVLADSSEWTADRWQEELHTCRALTLEEGENVKVVGLEIDTDFFLRAIDVRKWLDHVELNRVVMKTGWLDGVDSVGLATRVGRSDNRTVEIKDCYWYDDNESRDRYDTPYKFGKADVIADGWQFATETSGWDVVVSGSLNVDGTEYTPEPHYYNSSDLTIEDPRPLPEFGFDYSDQE